MEVRLLFSFLYLLDVINSINSQGAFMYAGGSAGTNSTYRANLRAFDKYGIIPRMLVNANQRSLEVCRLHALVLADTE